MRTEASIVGVRRRHAGDGRRSSCGARDRVRRCSIIPVITDHAEDKTLAAGGMHEGARCRCGSASRRSIGGRDVMVARDVALAGLAKGHLHRPHLERGRSRRCARARASGIHVTGEVAAPPLAHRRGGRGATTPTPRWFLPLRTEKTGRRCARPRRRRTTDVVATDHAPHHKGREDVEFDQAATRCRRARDAAASADAAAGRRTGFDLPTASRRLPRPAQILRLAAVSRSEVPRSRRHRS